MSKAEKSLKKELKIIAQTAHVQTPVNHSIYSQGWTVLFNEAGYKWETIMKHGNLI